MALPNKNDKKGKSNKKNTQNQQSSKFISKPAASGSNTRKPPKTGGTRGS
jgi:hypothetical protein